MKVKRKGAYQYEDLGFHQNQGGLVIPKAAEACMLYGIPVEEFIKNHLTEENKFDFILRTKVPRSSKLVMTLDDGTEVRLQNICRYYPSQYGGKLTKIMPPLEGDTEERRLGIDTQYNVLPCNDIADFDLNKVDLTYFYNEANKLLVGEFAVLDNQSKQEHNYTSDEE